ncbi:Oidioi.mRNA.OKI2018_I69.chr1.g3051.t1.cds [Oikopleura dioica]|uniref:Oidioi.mRNA.OKI2018_I69.chr1.g3051.t1.cds n=1 Tax=Oikopleura dioica TaxID=34765 RepID=A0ABN7SWV6_OIKDI|nr:Oidioi.mRNA.OKI2018_I69.chr1.g3051.t1.cds [Oikopleura dioica]
MGNTIVFVSNSTNPEELLDIYYDTTEIIFLYLSSLLLILIIGLNVLVGISVSIMRRRRDVQNMCFAFTQNLCLADTMVGFSIISVAVLSPPMKVSDENLGLQFRCAARVFVVGTCCQTSICALGTIAADRYSTIRRPFDRDQNFLLTSKGAWMLNTMIWTVSFVTNLLPIAGWSLDPDIDDLCYDSFREKATCRVSCLNFIPRGFAT